MAFDSKNRLAYSTARGEGNICTVKTPDDFLTVTYNFVS